MLLSIKEPESTEGFLPRSEKVRDISQEEDSNCE